MASNPAKETQNRSQRTRLAIHQDVEDRVDERKHEREIQGDSFIIGESEAEKGGRELKEHERGVEDRPDEDGVNQDVYRVAMVGPVESEVVF